MKFKETIILHMWKDNAKAIAKVLHFVLGCDGAQAYFEQYPHVFDEAASVAKFLEDEAKKCAQPIDRASRRKVFAKKSPVNKKPVSKKA